LIVWRGRCLTVHTTEERALAMILFAYLPGAKVIPIGVKKIGHCHRPARPYRNHRYRTEP
jgi:hypothetical protein